MKTTLPNLKKLAGRGRTEEPAESADIQTNGIEQIEGAAEPKPPPPLSLFFMLSHLEEDGPVRLDGVKLAVLEVMGLELDEPKLGAFAGSLNALDFPVQLLVRQHPAGIADPAELPGRGPARGPAPANPRRRRQPGAFVDHIGKPARASWTGGSTPSASTAAPTSCGRCWSAPVSACSP